MRFFLKDGEVLDFSKDELDKFDIQPLLTQLGKEERFYGTIPWTVLQHSIACWLVGQAVYEGDTLLTTHLLLHDLHEALIHDVPSFVKTKEFRAMEDQISSKMLSSLRIKPLSSEDIHYLKLIDSVMAYVEAFTFGSDPLINEVHDWVFRDYGKEPDIHFILLTCQSALIQVQEMGSMFNVVEFKTDEGETAETHLLLKEEVVEIFNEVIRLY